MLRRSFSVRRILRLVAVLTVLWQAAAEGRQTADFEDTKYVSELPGVGILTLELRKEYEGKRLATFLWLFEEIRGSWRFENGRIVFHRQGNYARDEDAAPTFILSPQEDGSLMVEGGSALDSQAVQFFAPNPWRPVTDQKSPEHALFVKARTQPQRFKERGQLLPLPESFPAPFMDMSALLFRDRSHTITALLEYPQLSRDTLEVVGDALLREEAGQGGFFVFPILGTHPNLSERLQKVLFALPKRPDVWRAVARNPSAPHSFYPEYLKRIREGDMSIRFGVARDQKAPREAWELALAPKEPEVLGEFSRNPAAPPDLLQNISENTSLRDPVGLAANEATPPDVLAQLSEDDDKQVLWAVKRNPSAPPLAVERVLRTLAESPGAHLRSTCADDPRLPQDLIPILAKDPSIQVRLVLAMNQAVPLSILIEMAEDPYRMVSERARDNIKKRFPDVAREANWKPLEELNPHNNLSQDFEEAIKAGDVARVRKILESTDDPDIKPNPSTIVGMILTHNFEPFKELLRETVIVGGAAETMVIHPNLKAHHLGWMIEQELLDPKLSGRLILFSTEKGRKDLLEEAKRLGLLADLRQPLKNACLFTATAMRQIRLVEFWMAEGAEPNQPVRENLSAVDIAAKTYSVDLLRLLDTEHRYEALLSELSKEFPPDPKSPLLGRWSNKKDGFSTVAFVLSPDGTGYMGASISSFPILWRSDDAGSATLVIVGPEGPVRDKPLKLEHDSARDVLLVEEGTDTGGIIEGGDGSPFFRIKEP